MLLQVIFTLTLAVLVVYIKWLRYCQQILYISSHAFGNYTLGTQFGMVFLIIYFFTLKLAFSTSIKYPFKLNTLL